jgi:hypothetical protein
MRIHLRSGWWVLISAAITVAVVFMIFLWAPGSNQ